MVVVVMAVVMVMVMVCLAMSRSAADDKRYEKLTAKHQRTTACETGLAVVGMGRGK